MKCLLSVWLQLWRCWKDRWCVYFWNFPFKYLPPVKTPDFQHVHWTSHVHSQQNFIEAKEKGWVFDCSYLKNHIVFRSWELEHPLSHENHQLFLPWSQSMSWLLLWACEFLSSASFFPSLLPVLEQNTNRDSRWCVFTRLRGGNVLSRAAPCGSQSCQEREVEWPNHGGFFCGKHYIPLEKAELGGCYLHLFEFWKWSSIF